MSRIVVENLYKSFQVAERQAGFFGAVKGIVSRRYKHIDALKNVSFNIEPGELVGYIGPNGAGKSTSIKILSGILVPDRGRCEVDGLVPWKSRVQHVRNIGVVFGQRTQLWWDLPVVESFQLLKDIYRIPSADYHHTTEELIETMGIGALLDTPVRQLSLGQRMRCDLVASLLHKPQILFLDEPTIGLDAVAKLAIRRFILELNKQRGITVILTTHDMDDIEALCQRIMVIGSGRLLSDGSIDTLRQQVNRERRIKVEFQQETTLELGNINIISREGNTLHLGFNPQDISTHELIAYLSRHHPVKDLLVENPPIEELIATLYTQHFLTEVAGD